MSTLQQPSNTAESPFKILSRSAPLLVCRGIVIGGLQFFAKRAVFAQADESLLPTYAIYSAIEGLIFILVFRGFRIISAKAAYLHAKEIESHAHLTAFNATEMGVLYRQGVLLGGALMIPAFFLCISAPSIFRLTNQSDETIKNSAPYFFYGFIGYAADMLYRSRARIDIGRLQPASALIGDIIESVIDVTGTYLLVNGKWGLPKMGVVSGAIAYMVSAITIATAYNLRSYYHPVYQHYQLYHFSWQEFKKCFYSPEFKILLWGGLHIAFKFSIVNITFILTTQLCRLSGSAALIGLQAAGAY